MDSIGIASRLPWILEIPYCIYIGIPYSNSMGSCGHFEAKNLDSAKFGELLCEYADTNRNFGTTMSLILTEVPLQRI